MPLPPNRPSDDKYTNPRQNVRPSDGNDGEYLNASGHLGGSSGAAYGHHQSTYDGVDISESSWEQADSAARDWARWNAANPGNSRGQYEQQQWERRRSSLDAAHNQQLENERFRESMMEMQGLMAEYMNAMAEYQKQAVEQMMYVEPEQEPLKNAQQDMSNARADTNRRQLLRRGLMSTFGSGRYGASGQQRLGA